MHSKISNTNESFLFLRGSSEFQNIILNNINSCVLLLDKDMRLQAFNDAFKTIFSNKKDEDILYKHCGEAIGCAFQIEEGVDCGKTSQCVNCELRIAAFDAYFDGKIVYKEHIQRPFFDQNNQKVYKDLQFSTRKFHFNKDKYIVMMIEDITKIKQLERDLKSN